MQNIYNYRARMIACKFILIEIEKYFSFQNRHEFTIDKIKRTLDVNVHEAEEQIDLLEIGARLPFLQNNNCQSQYCRFAHKMSGIDITGHNVTSRWANTKPFQGDIFCVGPKHPHSRQGMDCNILISYIAAVEQIKTGSVIINMTHNNNIPDLYEFCIVSFKLDGL